MNQEKRNRETVVFWEVFLGEIKPVRVSHETKQFVTVLHESGHERKYKKRGENWSFFPTKREAAIFLETQLIEEKSRAIERLAEAEVRLHEFRRKYQKELAAT